MLKKELTLILEDLSAHKREKSGLMLIYVKERLDTLLESYVYDINKSRKYLGNPENKATTIKTIMKRV